MTTDTNTCAKMQHLTNAPGGHPGKAGNDWGTGYFPIGNKAGIGAGIVGIIGGGMCLLYMHITLIFVAHVFAYVQHIIHVCYLV